MNKIILDANVLLTGIFVAESKSRLVLADIQQGKKTGYIAENTIDEAENVSERVFKKTGVSVSETIRGAINSLNMLIIPRISRIEAKIYSKIKGIGDKALVAAAKKIDAVICTNDITDFKRASFYNVTVITPHNLMHDGSIGLQTVFPGFVSTPEQGTFYAETRGLNWTGVKFDRTAKNRMYFFDYDGFGSLYFDASTHSFVFQMDNGASLSIKYGVISSNDFPIKIVLTYQAKTGIDMYIGYRGKRNSLKTSWNPSDVHCNLGLSLGNDRHKKNQLNGTIYTIFSIPSYATEKAANNMMANITVKQPWERLGLEQIIRLMYGITN